MHPQVLCLWRHPYPRCLPLSWGGWSLLCGKDLHPRRTVHQGRNGGWPHCARRQRRRWPSALPLPGCLRTFSLNNVNGRWCYELFPQITLIWGGVMNYFLSILLKTSSKSDTFALSSFTNERLGISYCHRIMVTLAVDSQGSERGGSSSPCSHRQRWT